MPSYGPMAEPSVLSAADRRKLDSGPDGDFYESPRFVTHADDGFLERLTELYDETVPDGGRVFDAMNDILRAVNGAVSPRSGPGRPSHPAKWCVGSSRPTRAKFRRVGVLRFVLGT